MENHEQCFIANPTMEAKYTAACEASKEGVWLCKFMNDLEVNLNMENPFMLYCDGDNLIKVELFDHFELAICLVFEMNIV